MGLVAGDQQQRTGTQFFHMGHQVEVKESVRRGRRPDTVRVDGTGMERPAFIVVEEIGGHRVCPFRQFVGKQRYAFAGSVNGFSVSPDGNFMITGQRFAQFRLFPPHLGQISFHGFPLGRSIVISLIVVPDAVVHIVQGRGCHRFNTHVVDRRGNSHAA